MRLLVGVTLCGRPKTIIGKWQLIIKISSTRPDHYPHLYIIRSRYILIFEENYGRFVVLSSLLTPNFNALLNLIQGLLRKPRLPLTANSLPDFSSTVFYEKISGIPAS